MIEYGHDIGNMKAFADEELTIELDMRSIPKETIQKILGSIPIVRCEDCKHFNDYFIKCEHNYGLRSCQSESFCCYAEKR